ncbi:zinc ribbon domain-containing protein [Sporolactobacillus pectinivorans]|uniref:zinc ribbon domain-containing protein n=1 Tax=Sporolactobacillus pectinivorans TaxID=1591408 RepID=UPI0012FDE31A|nr:zinc ribbon domain-containing protein [Sporolactobacillus pectinivorans]
MFCRNCGAKNPDGARFCANCGASLIAPHAPAQSQEPKMSDIPSVSEEPKISETLNISEPLVAAEAPISADVSAAPDAAIIPGLPGEARIPDDVKDLEMIRRPEMVRPPEGLRIPEQQTGNLKEQAVFSDVFAATAQRETRFDEPETKTRLHKKLWLIPLLIVVILGAVAYFTGKYLTDPSRTVAAFEQAVRDQNVHELKKLILPNEHADVNDNQIQAMLRLFDSQPDTYRAIVASLNQSAKSPDIIQPDNMLYYLQKSGKKYLIFDNYRIGTNSIQAKITTNLQGMQVGILGVGHSKIADQADSNTPQTLDVGPVIPGEYTFYGKSKVLNTSKMVSLTSAGKNVDFSGVYIQVRSNISDAELYVNGKDTGETIAEAGAYGPFKKNDTPVFYAKYTVNGQSIQTDPVSVSSGNSSFGTGFSLDQAQTDGIDLNFNQVDSGNFYVLDSQNEQANISTLNNYFPGFYDALSTAVSLDDATNFANYFESGTDYAKAQIQSADNFYKQGVSESNTSFNINSVISLGGGVFSVTVDESWDETITDPNSGSQTSKSFSYTDTYQLKETAPGILKIVGQKITNRQDTSNASSSGSSF